MEPDRGPPQPAETWSYGWPQTLGEFERFVEAFQDRLVRYAFRRLGNIQDAEDVIQEVFVRAYDHRAGRVGVADVNAYLYRMAANACTDVLRKRKQVEVPLDEIGGEEAPVDRTDAAQVATAAEELREMEKLLRRLPRAQAEVLRLRVFDGLRLAEIAVVLDCAVGTVKSRLRYGLDRLRGALLRKSEVAR